MELRTVWFLYNSLQFLEDEQNPVWNSMTEKELFISLTLPLPRAGNKENGNIESRILIGCVPCTMIPVYTL